MLKRIETGAVTLGMFIHKLEGNWFSHPFWTTRFLLIDPEQLDQLQASKVTGVIIDTEHGLDPDNLAPHGAIPPLPAPLMAKPAVRAGSGGFAISAAEYPRTPAQPPAKPARVLAAPPNEVSRAFGKAQVVAERGLKLVAEVFLEMRLGKAITPARLSPAIDSVIASVQASPFAFNGLMRLRQDGEDIYRHGLATSALMIALGRTMRLPPADVHAAGQAGLLLDIGMAKLRAERADGDRGRGDLPAEVWQSHVRLGYDFILKSRLPLAVAGACLEHHERIDGTGWPGRMSGAAISKLGRMAAICDTYDTLASATDGRPGLDPAQALRQMRGDHGAFDPALIALFETTIGIWPTGTVVELRSGRMAVVIDQNRDAADRPLVAVFYAPASRERIGNTFIDLSTCYGTDAIAGPGLIDALPLPCRTEAAAALAAAIARVVPASPAKPVNKG